KKAVEKTLSGALRTRIMALAARTGDTEDLTKLNRVIASVRACKAQTKQDHLIKKFDQLRKLGKIIIFTEFLETQADLQKRLSARGIGCVIFKGGEMKEKENAIDTFRTPSCDVMISTETGAQGLDLEFANVIVNFDFPWNPMRLEQRIGRVDRPKQEHDIY